MDIGSQHEHGLGHGALTLTCSMEMDMNKIWMDRGISIFIIFGGRNGRS
jgi:hypothetical protein